MTHVATFSFNPWQENTYVLFDDTNECVIIDPGCYDEAEQRFLTNFIESNALVPKRLLNTHCHLDHIFANKFVHDTYQLGLEIHEEELPVLRFAPKMAQLYNLQCEASPMPSRYIQVGEEITFGNTLLISLFTPGHSPGSLSFYCPASDFVIAGDALFQGSIGRTDLPGGDHETLLRSIEKELFTLPESTKVYAGHGPSTEIGYEKSHNPFFEHLR